MEICDKTGGSYTASKLTAEHPSESLPLKESIGFNTIVLRGTLLFALPLSPIGRESIGLTVMLYVEHLSLKCDYCGLNGE